MKRKKKLFSQLALPLAFSLAPLTFTLATEDAPTSEPAPPPSTSEIRTESARWELWSGSWIDASYHSSSNAYSGNILEGRPRLAPALGFWITDTFELLFSPGFYFHTAGNYLANAQLGIGWNGGGTSHHNDFFLQAWAGFDDALDNKTSDHPQWTLKYFTWSLALGKRFECTSSIAYSPEIAFKVIHETYSNILSFTVVPLQFSLFL
jgi:hypothetical protein